VSPTAGKPTSHSLITVGNGHTIPVSYRGTSSLPIANTTFTVNNVLITPVRQFTRDNNCSIEFDASGFSVKDLSTGHVLLRCNSSGDLYTISPDFPSTAASCSLTVSTTLWHHRLGHASAFAVSSLQNMPVITCTHAVRSLCHACQLGKHMHLPFAPSVSTTTEPFALVHYDVWTSPVLSNTGYKYYHA
jgi:hypothetical protein